MKLESIRVCTGACNRLTRWAGVRKDQAPNTVIRVRDGKCRVCLEGNTEDLSGVIQTRSAGVSGPALCTGTCGRMTRTSKSPAAQFPGTVVRGGGGMCMTCKRNSDPEVRKAHQEADRRRRQDQAPAPAPEESIEVLSRELAAYFAWRRPHRQKQARRSAA